MVHTVDHESRDYPDRIEIPLETELGVDGAHLVMCYGQVVEVVIPLISYDSKQRRMSEEWEVFITDAFVEVCRSVRMFLGSRDNAEPGRYPKMWWYPFTTLAVAIDRSYNNVELRLLDINEMYYREQYDRGLLALEDAEPPPDSLYTPLTVKSWDELQKRLIEELMQLKAGSHLIIRHRITKTSLQLMQGSDHKRKIDFLYCELEDIAGPVGTWMMDKDRPYLLK